jgi:hypothetical protein
VVGLPVYAVGAALAQALGEVVGEAWGGAFLHQLGHAIGTVLHIWLLVAAAWLVLRDRLSWVQPWAIAGAIGSLVGLVLYLLVLSLAESPEELIIALSLYLPLLGAVVAQSRALRGHIDRPRRWAAAWFLAILFGVGAAWYAGGGVAGASVGSSLHPVFEKAVAYGWRMIPRSLLGGVVYATWTALTVPLARGAS